jgi:hypothetical protein
VTVTDADAEIRQRIQQFSLLRAAQRALSRCMHPSALDPVREHSRQLLIQLQALADAGADEAERHAEALAGIDRLLAHQMGLMLEIVADLEFEQLRAAGPRLCSEHPDDVRALIDVMLKYDIRHNKPLRLLEFLITMLSTEESNGRRRIVQEPGQLTPGLRELAAQRVSESGPAPAAAEATLGNAVGGLIGGDDTAGMRDEMRRYKRELGSDILHPRVLARAVAYNVAMWNRVAARIDGTQAIDQLADDLLEDLSRAAEGAARSGSAQVDVLGSPGFARLVEAFRARLTGGSIADGVVARIVASFELRDLAPREIQAVESGGANRVDRLIGECVVLARAIRHRAEVRDSLEALSIEPESLTTDALPELMNETAAAARKLFADGSFDEAFALSEVRSRNLGGLAKGRSGSASRSDGAAPTDGSFLARWRLPMGVDPSPRLLAAVRPPVIVSTPEKLDPSSRFFYRVEAEDGDGDRNLRYELLKRPRGMEMDVVTGELTWTPERDQAGTHRVEVAVDDRHGGRATQAFDIPITVTELMPKSPPASIR